jgi:hypothetical protein
MQRMNIVTHVRSLHTSRNHTRVRAHTRANTSTQRYVLGWSKHYNPDMDAHHKELQEMAAATKASQAVAEQDAARGRAADPLLEMANRGANNGHGGAQI